MGAVEKEEWKMEVLLDDYHDAHEIDYANLFGNDHQEKQEKNDDPRLVVVVVRLHEPSNAHGDGALRLRPLLRTRKDLPSLVEFLPSFYFLNLSFCVYFCSVNTINISRKRDTNL